MADITMPQLGETVTEGTITRWLKQVGDEVAEDEVLFEVSTDKVDSEVPSPASGYISEILVPEGDTVDVGTRLAVISAQAPSASDTAGQATEASGEPVDAAGEPSGGGEAQPTSGADTEATETGAAPPPATTPPATTPPATTPPEADQAAEEAPAQNRDQGVDEAEPEVAADAGPEAGADGEPEPRRATAAPASQRPAPGGPAGGGGTRPAAERPPGGPAGGGQGRVLSPVVRRLIAEHDLDPSQIQGTGAGGRITRADVLSLIDQRGTAAGNGESKATRAPSPAPAKAAPTQPEAPTAPAKATGSARAEPPVVKPGERDTVVPFTNIRRRTAEHMVRSKQTSAHTVVAMEVDFSAVQRARLAHAERFREHEGFGLTYLPFISRAVVDAIGEWPHVNSSVGDDQLIVHNYINLGIAVDLNYEGLLVPVIHDAGDKRLAAIAREISGLAQRARAKRLTMDDISGGTFTITNAGPFGTLFTIPVINQPQVAILATDGVRKKPVVIELADGTDSIAVHPVGNLVLSFDHRAFDGAYASAFMALVEEILQTRDWSAEL